MAIWILRNNKMIPELKRLHSPDIIDLINYAPEDSSSFSLLVQAMVGPKGENWEESFDIDVCTPSWIEKNQKHDEVLIARHFLIVLEYDYRNIVKTINDFLKNCSGENWDEVALKVSRLGLWEFEDYIEE